MVEIGQYINWILTLLLIALVCYGIYNKMLFQPTCDCKGSYEEICKQVSEEIEKNNYGIYNVSNKINWSKFRTNE